MFVRFFDKLGRIVIPKEMRDSMCFDSRDGVAIFSQDDMIILKKNVYACFVCGSEDEVEKFMKGHCCKECREKLSGV